MDSTDISVQAKELQNNIKIQILLSRAADCLRKLFLKRWREFTSSDWNSSTVGDYFNGIGWRVQQKIQKLQMESMLSGDVKLWDITTVTAVLLMSEFPQKHLRPSQEERSMLEELKKVRNVFAHNPDHGLDDEKFESLWERTTKVLIFFDYPTEELDKLRSSTNLGVFQDENSVENMIKANSEEASRLASDAKNLHNVEKYEDAIGIYSKAIGLSGLLESQLGILYSNRSSCYLAKAKKLANSGKSSEDLHCALQDGKKVIELNPTWFRGYFRTGNAYMELHEYMKALGHFDNALSLSPGKEELLAARDNCRLKLNQDSRQDHLHPSRMPRTKEEELSDWQSRLGSSIKVEAAKSLVENYQKAQPGGAFVIEANEYMSGPNKDPKAAATLYAKAASLGNTEGIFNLAILYKKGHESGPGVKQDLKMYIKLMREVAAQSPVIPGTTHTPNVYVGQAEYNIGLAYAEGIGVIEDFVEAASWYQKATDHGCAAAANNLAFLYMYGRGVPLDIERGVQLWKLAADLGEPMAMRNLANHYLKFELDAKSARMWQARAIKHGHFEAKINANEFESDVKAMEEKSKELLTNVVQWEIENGLSESLQGLSLKKRVERMKKGINPKAAAVELDLKKLFSDAMSNGSTPLWNKCQTFDEKMLAKHAKVGSETAGKMLKAIQHLKNVYSLSMLSDPKPNSERILNELAECYRLEPLVVQLTPEWKQKLCGIVSLVLTSIPDRTKSDLDRDARICFGFMMMDNPQHMLTFMKHSKEKYPNELAFHSHYLDMCGFLRKHAHALEEIKKSLKIFPNEYNLLYTKAGHLRLDESHKIDVKHTTNIITAFQEFISAAPKDHRKVPEAYYAIANEYLTMHMKNEVNVGRNTEYFGKMKEFYELGLKAEKIQLPCFLPYDCNKKDLIQKFLPVLLMKMKPSMTKLTPNIKVQAKDQDLSKFTNLNRLLIIKSHRKDIEDRKNLLNPRVPNGYIQVTIPFVTQGSNKQRAPSQLCRLEPILFSEMDTAEDKVYEGRVIQVTSIDNPAIGVYAGNGIRLALEDENGNVQRAFIFDYPKNEERMLKEKLGFGAKLSILNPYMRLPPDGHFGIRVDDWTTLYFHSGASASEAINRCRFCGNGNAVHRCGKCKWAKYCGRKCQEMDWNLAKHKLICYPSTNAN